MRATRFPIDGLWRCLCPSIDSFVLSRNTLPVRGARILPKTRPPKLSQPRALSFHSQDPVIVAEPSNKPIGEPGNTSVPEHIGLPDISANDVHRKLRPKPRGRIITFSSNDDDSLAAIPLEELHEILKEASSQSNSYHRVTNLVEYLVRVRGEKPSLLLYDSLVRANSDAVWGSIDVVEGLMNDMENQGIRANSWFYHGILQVMVNHPNHILRNKIMQEMKDHWFGLSPEGWHNMVLTHLRDREYEMALDKFEQMHVDRIHIQPWLYDILMFQLCDAGELDEVFRLLRQRYEELNHDIDPLVWYILLDKFTDAFHLEATKYIWQLRVQPGYLNPSDGMCLNIINLAARYADPVLATATLRTLSSRKTALSAYHYEALLEAYTKSGDVKTAFRILIVMAKAGLEPSPNNTRPLYLYLSGADKAGQESNARPYAAWKSLEELHEEGHIIPTTAVNVVLEALVSSSGFEEALSMYKGLHTVCINGANSETFNILLRALSNVNEYGERHPKYIRDPKPSAMFIAAEMRALNVKPNRITYDRLILICIREDDYEDAFKYLREMVKVGKSRGEDWWMRGGTARAMVRTCVFNGDKRAWDLLEQFKKYGIDFHDLQVWAKNNWPENMLHAT